MSGDRLPDVVWAVYLALVTAAVAGAVVSARSAATQLRHVVGFLFLFAPVLYALIRRRRGAWERAHPFVRFAVFFLGAFVAIVVLDLVVDVLFGGFGLATAVLEFLASLAGFGVAVWLLFYGGADLIWVRLVDWLDIDW